MFRMNLFKEQLYQYSIGASVTEKEESMYS